MTCRARSDRQRGAALVIAVLVFALSTTLVVAMTSEFTLVLKRGQNTFVARQSEAYLRGGEDLATLVLQQDIEEDRRQDTLRDDLDEVWAQQVPPYALDEGGWLAGRLEDLQGRFNLNSLAEAAPQGQRFTAAQEQFIRLLHTPEEPRVSQQDAILIMEAVQDWLDADSRPRDFGAEDDFYYDLVPSYRAANREFFSVSELRLVAHMTPEIYLAIEPHLTVYGPGTLINIHTAPQAVLRTINAAGNLSPLSREEGEVLMEMREADGFADVQTLLESSVLAGRELSPGLRARLGETSQWFLYVGEVEVAERVARLYSVLRRNGSRVDAVLRSTAAI